jgi:hypothetical protein
MSIIPCVCSKFLQWEHCYTMSVRRIAGFVLGYLTSVYDYHKG